ncbi:NEFA-interacting nuclear NIP30 [Hyphodiscus hymeniophilus]|uniref:NEFA-interacting nuclear NIP30 n=1 Tax=Hyphodiscus hymeniophilus TaxID=353542 RepID=A0A9P7AY77_9HELO|nr:NEFA-interacting nuclear NIP30 [Hyphodiscus hymeniophilus]
MSSGFVSGGTNDEPVKRSDEWLAAQQEIEANRQRKAIEARQSDGRSLFETLEANKAAKQDAFEEANRLKNQFRSLDEDEVEFLDSVLESTRAEEQRVKRETAKGLEQFRKQQDEADKKARRGSEDAQAADAGSPLLEGEQWVAGGRKRKRAKEKEVLKGVKVRRSSTTEEINKPPVVAPSSSNGLSSAKQPAESTKSAVPMARTKPALATAEISPAPAKTSLGLVDYGSDEDD